jgi:hypothetical protein
MSPIATAQSSAIALNRWKTGHHVFHLYLVTMVTLLNELIDDIEDLEETRVVSLLLDLTALLEAATAGMKYASAFDPSAYAEAVRPTMMPPGIPEGFSGALNLDHKRMLKALQLLPRALRRRFGEAESLWPDAIAACWKQLNRAHREARMHHGLVCTRLVPDRLSLRLSAGRRGGAL